MSIVGASTRVLDVMAPTPWPAWVGPSEIDQIWQPARTFSMWDNLYGGLPREAPVAQLRWSAGLIEGSSCPADLRPDPHRGRGGSADVRSPRRPRPLAGAGAVAHPEPDTQVVVDNGATGSPDGFHAFLGATDCSTLPGFTLALSFGDIVIRDAPSKDQCRNGGWRNYTDAAGQPFKSQGQCTAFALGVA